MKPSRDNLIQFLANVEGFLRDDEALLLHDLAKKSKVNIVEIGSWKGKSTIALASGTNTTIYAIDPHTGSPEHRQKNSKINTFKEFKQNLQKAQITKQVIPLKTTSHQAASKFNQPIDLLFIDGNHSYHSVKQDFNDWQSKLINGGVIAFHDTISWSGPRRLVIEKIYQGNQFKDIKLLGSITYATKTSHLSPLKKAKNYYALFIRHLRKIFTIIPTPKPIRNFLKKTFQFIQ